MSETLAGKHRSDEIRKIMTTSVLAAIGDPAIHGVWLSLGQFSELLHAKHPNGECLCKDFILQNWSMEQEGEREL
jgi:hypothetical protein